jgi:hypothetical protein
VWARGGARNLLHGGFFWLVVGTPKNVLANTTSYYCTTLLSSFFLAWHLNKTLLKNESSFYLFRP